jgi:hypothetical protein
VEQNRISICISNDTNILDNLNFDPLFLKVDLMIRLKYLIFFSLDIYMEYLDKLFAGRDMTESSKLLYSKNLIRLNAGNDVKSLSFIKDEKKILEKLAKYKPNTQRTYIISIVSALKGSLEHEPKNKKIFEKYSQLMDQFNKDLKTNNEPTDKETENWIPVEEINAKKEELSKEVDALPKRKALTESQYQVLQKLLLLSLYTDQPPRRNNDYQNMMVVSKSTDLPTDKNYLFLDSMKFKFNNFKTAKSKGSQEEEVRPALRKVLDIYLKVFPLAKMIKDKGVLAVPLLVNFKGEQYTNVNDMTRLLYKIFNKKVGCSQFRKMFLTDKYGKVMEEMNADASAMATSTNMVKDQYVKNI